VAGFVFDLRSERRAGWAASSASWPTVDRPRWCWW
jgi:hypothetical protein